EGDRVGGWVLIVVSVLGGLALEVVASSQPTDPPSLGLYHLYPYPNVAPVYLPRRTRTGATTYGLLGLLVAGVGVVLGFALANTPDVSTWGPAPRADYTPHRAIGPSI